MQPNLLNPLRKKRFTALFLTQFFGAFNDNAFKLAMLTSISYSLSVSQHQSEFYQAIASGLFILPFFLFSASAGQLADKYDKALMIRIIKLFEIILMSIGGVGFYLGSIPILMVTLTGMGIHSTFFGPIKYAILPEQLEKRALLSATSLIEASTFLAILFGTILGSLSVTNPNHCVLYAILLTLSAAVFGFIASLFIPRLVGADQSINVDWQLFRATTNILQDALMNKRIMPTIVALSWFWLIGIVVLTKLPDYTKYTLHAKSTVFTIFLGVFSVGVATGSMFIGWALKERIMLRYVPLCMLLLSVFMFDLYWSTPSNVKAMPLQTIQAFFGHVNHWRITFDLFMLAFSGGLFVVPLYTHLQVVSENLFRSRTIAANNILNAFFMVLGALLVMILAWLNVSIAQVFLIFGLLNIGALLMIRQLMKRSI